MEDKPALILVALFLFTCIGITGIASEILDTNEEFALFAGLSLSILVYLLVSYHTRRDTTYQGY